MLLSPLQWFVASLDDEVFNAVHVDGDDGFLAFVGFQEGQGELAVHESVLGEDCGGVGVLEEVEGGLEVGISVGKVGPDLVAGKVLPYMPVNHFRDVRKMV